MENVEKEIGYEALNSVPVWEPPPFERACDKDPFLISEIQRKK